LADDVKAVGWIMVRCVFGIWDCHGNEERGEVRTNMLLHDEIVIPECAFTLGMVVLVVVV
jgi:hypothetical protein